MSITVEELRNMNPDTYQLIDIRSESEIAHGAIPGATAIPGEEIASSEQIWLKKALMRKVWKVGILPGLWII